MGNETAQLRDCFVVSLMSIVPHHAIRLAVVARCRLIYSGGRSVQQRSIEDEDHGGSNGGVNDGRAVI